MINWMMEEILPKVKNGAAPEATLLKFANEKNLTAALLEGMGQLYNTAKTLSYLEKSANRGGTFPMIDVPEMLDKYLEVNSKKAETKSEFKADDTSDLPNCFDGFFGSNPWANEIALSEPVLHRKVASVPGVVDYSNNKVLCEFIQQAQFEAKEEVRETMQKIATGLRECYPDFTFQDLESDALLNFGDSVKPAMEKLASFVSGSKWPIKRAVDAGAPRLIRDTWQFLPKIEELQHGLVKLATAGEMLKESAMPATASSSSVLDRMVTESRRTQASHTPSKDLKKNSEPGVASDEKPKAENKSKDNKPEPAPEGTYFGKLNQGVDKFGPPLLKRYAEAGMATMRHPMSQRQKHVDTSMRDTQHLAVLQNLLNTDDVLADADHDKVVDMYNTLRENAPHLAGDANVARVILRSMVQHDGISPFDLKSFLDTEQARQKVDLSNRQLEEHLYKGKDLPGTRGATAP